MFHVGIFPHFGALKIKVIFLNVRYLSHQMSEFGSFFFLNNGIFDGACEYSTLGVLRVLRKKP